MFASQLAAKQLMIAKCRRRGGCVTFPKSFELRHMVYHSVHEAGGARIAALGLNGVQAVV